MAAIKLPSTEWSEKAPEKNRRWHIGWFKKENRRTLTLIFAFGSFITGLLTIISYGNYYTPSLQISNGHEIAITPNSYFVGEKISFHIPVYANSGSSEDEATFSYTLYQNGEKLDSRVETIYAEHPRLFSILLNTTAQNVGRDYFKIEFIFEGKNDEPLYKGGDTEYKYIGEIFGNVEVNERLVP
ncbi:MAG: hypothetical protein HMLIMOIP_002626 [Candidatus Nitrosomirales archaeon]|jgi:hypothetical protein